MVAAWAFWGCGLLDQGWATEQMLWLWGLAPASGTQPPAKDSAEVSGSVYCGSRGVGRRRHSPTDQNSGAWYLGGGAQDGRQGIPLQEVRQLGRATQGSAGLKPVGWLRGAGLWVSEHSPQRVRGRLRQLGVDHVQVGQVGGTVQAAAQPSGTGRVLGHGGAWGGTGQAWSLWSAGCRACPAHTPPPRSTYRSTKSVHYTLYPLSHLRGGTTRHLRNQAQRS